MPHDSCANAYIDPTNQHCFSVDSLKLTGLLTDLEYANET